ncbi:MAG: hypothetical protein AB1403_15525, partial [Candidatus Riflebacteria bacterium]
IALYGGINVHELIAEEDIFGRTATGDIMVANVSGRKVVLMADQNNAKVDLDLAKLGEALSVSASEFNGDKIEHTNNSDNLKLDFSSANGEYMKDVSINMISSEKGVQVDDLDSITVTINTDCDDFSLNDLNILAVGQFSNKQTSVVIAGSENYSSDVKISGAGVAVNKRETKRSQQSSTEKIASIVNSSNESMNGDARQQALGNSNKSESMIEFTGLSSDRINSEMLASHDGKVFLMAENEEDKQVEEVIEEENAEKENHE